MVTPKKIEQAWTVEGDEMVRQQEVQEHAGEIRMEEGKEENIGRRQDSQV